MMHGTDRTTARLPVGCCQLSLLLLGLATLGFCSCRTLPTPSLPGNASADRPAAEQSEAVPASATPAATGSLSDADQQPASSVQPAAAVLPFEVPQAVVATRRPDQPAPPRPALPHGYHGYVGPQIPCGPAAPWASKPGCGPTCCNLSPWVPPGLTPPWPKDEYLFDGGDHTPKVQVERDWSVEGLNLEDTVIHYDTLDGQTRVQPSNRVCLYAPRFASVRKVYGALQHEQHQRSAGVELPVPLSGLGDVQSATTNVQPLQPGLGRAALAPGQFLERQPPVTVENREGLIGAYGSLLPYEDFRIIRDGLMDSSEKARLASRIDAAVAWSHDKAVQVVIDNIATQEDVGITAAEGVHVYELHGKPRVRICKVASRCDAQPGEIVEFTIRFDNVGDQVIGNVTIIDNLTTRLEYVADSQSCSRKADFSSSENQGESLALRWEIVEPVPVNEGGVIRFRCQVR